MGKQKKKRAKSSLDALKPEIKEQVKKMISAGDYYREIVAYLKTTGWQTSESTVRRYAERHIEYMKNLQLVSESFRSMSEELNKYPEMDITEGILRVACKTIFDQVSAITDEDAQKMDVTDLLKQVNQLVRAVNYKKLTDAKIRELRANGYEEIKKLFFDTMAKEDPVLYEQVVRYLNKKKEEGPMA